MNWGEFWNMGGYAVYVWGSWGITLITMAALIANTVNRKKRLTNTLRRKLRREQQLTKTRGAS